MQQRSVACAQNLVETAGRKHILTQVNDQNDHVVGLIFLFGV